jgi:ChrR Cupin-like domain
MPKPALEFFNAEAVAWTPVDDQPGAHERVLAHDPATGGLTRILRWAPGVDTSQLGAVVHEYVEEVFILAGSMHDLMFDQTFSVGYYACCPPGTVHGPWRTEHGCEMLQVRY